jgi:hypothetical protein
VTPVLVVDNGRVIGRGHVKTGPDGAKAHLTFTDVAWPTVEQQAAAVRSVAEINVEVKRRLEEAERHHRNVARTARYLMIAFRAWQVVKVLGAVAMAVIGAWAITFFLFWLIAAPFGFAL